MNKTNRKNKTNQNINWPIAADYFTIKQLFALNPDVIPITLRVKLDKSIKKDKTVAVIGYRNQGKGRPEMILAHSPVSQELLDKASKMDGFIPSESKPLIKVMDISTSEIPSTDVNLHVDTTQPASLPAQAA